jgi:hypothetical protein
MEQNDCMGTVSEKNLEHEPLMAQKSLSHHDDSRKTFAYGGRRYFPPRKQETVFTTSALSGEVAPMIRWSGSIHQLNGLISYRKIMEHLSLAQESLEAVTG